METSATITQGAWRTVWQKARELAITGARVGLLYFALTIFDVLLAFFFIPNDYQEGYWYSADAVVSAGSVRTFGEQLASTYPQIQPESIRLDSSAQDVPENCGAGAVHLGIPFRATLLRSVAIQDNIPAQLRAAGFPKPCAGPVRSAQMGSIQSPLGPVYGGLVFAPVLLLILALARKRERLRSGWADWRPRVGLMRGAGIGLLTAAVSCMGVMVLGIAGQTIGWFDASDAPSLADSRDSLLLALPTAVLVAPLVEEYLFRALLLERFARIIPPWLALFWTAGAFAVIHIPHSAFEWMALLFAGIMYGALWLRTRSLFACWVGHGAFNAAMLLQMWIMLGDSASIAP